jgi:hypothetical protein
MKQLPSPIAVRRSWTLILTVIAVIILTALAGVAIGAIAAWFEIDQ